MEVIVVVAGAGLGGCFFAAIVGALRLFYNWSGSKALLDSVGLTAAVGYIVGFVFTFFLYAVDLLKIIV